MCVRAHSAVVRVSSLQLFTQTSVCFSQQDELLVQQEDVLLQLLTAAQLETQTQQQQHTSQQTLFMVLNLGLGWFAVVEQLAMKPQDGHMHIVQIQ